MFPGAAWLILQYCGRAYDNKETKEIKETNYLWSFGVTQLR